METFQTRVTKMIAAKIEAAGLEVSATSSFANMGTVNGHKPGVLIPCLVVDYNFQTGTYTLRLTVEGRRIPSQIGRDDYFDFYHQDLRAGTRFWDCLDTALSCLKPVPVAKPARRRA